MTVNNSYQAFIQYRPTVKSKKGQGVKFEQQLVSWNYYCI